MRTPSLRETQSWMLTAMLAPGEGAAAARLARARFGFDVDDLIAAPPAGPREARLGIYASGYVLRLLECLRSEFPALRRLLSDPLFDFFARAYVLECPSRSFTLLELGRGFADFLQRTQARQASANLALPLDLARLERARSEASYAKGTENDVGTEVGGVMSFALSLLGGASVEVAAPPCLRLLSLSYPLHRTLEAFDRGEAGLEIPDAAPTFVAVTRRHYRVRVLELAPWQYAFLAAAAAPQSAFACAVACARESGRPLDEILADLLLWLPAIASEGALRVRST